MLSTIFSTDQFGTEATVVRIEAASENGNPAMVLTGLVSQEVRESQERIRVAVRRLGFDVPRSRLVIHLHPPDRPKKGNHWDLPLALVTLAAEGMAGLDTRTCGAVGMLSLTGEVNPVPGALAMVQSLLAEPQLETIFVPWGNTEVALLKDRRIRWVRSLAQAVGTLRGTQAPDVPTPVPLTKRAPLSGPSLDQVRGHHFAKRTLEVALAGRHSALWVGPPGVGKTFLAECAMGLLPPLTQQELLEVTKARLDGSLAHSRPFRAPHHTIPASRLLGGGTGRIQAGEVSLAHLGVLFLDEIGEFRRDALEGLREPLQSGGIEIHRGSSHCRLPAQFTLLAAMNPCPCGFSLGGRRRCECSSQEVSRYRKRLSGPLRDRFSMVAVMGLTEEIGDTSTGSADRVRESIQGAWQRQHERWGGLARNGEVGLAELMKQEQDPSVSKWLTQCEPASHPRTRVKLLQVAQTLADLSASPRLTVEHLEESWLLGQSQRNWEDLSTH